MTTPQEERPPAQPASGPTVSTAPPRSRWSWPRVPAHVGPARTSTLILALLFVGVFALYLGVRPEPATVATTTTGGGAQPTQVQQPAPTATRTAPRTTPTTTPTRTSATNSSASTSTARTTTSSGVGGPATDTGTSPAPTTPSLLPTTGSAPTS